MKHITEFINEHRVKTLLWIDDIRDPNTGDWIRNFSPIGADVKVIWVKSYDECVKYITSKGLPTAVCFDHDLGDVNREDDDEKTGYDCAKWIADYCMDHHKKYPAFNIQSDNGPGRENICRFIINFKKHTHL